MRGYLNWTLLENNQTEDCLVTNSGKRLYIYTPHLQKQEEQFGIMNTDRQKLFEKWYPLIVDSEQSDIILFEIAKKLPRGNHSFIPRPRNDFKVDCTTKWHMLIEFTTDAQNKFGWPLYVFEDDLRIEDKFGENEMLIEDTNGNINKTWVSASMSLLQALSNDAIPPRIKKYQKDRLGKTSGSDGDDIFMGP